VIWTPLSRLVTSKFPSLRKQVAEACYLWAAGLRAPRDAGVRAELMHLVLAVWQEDEQNVVPLETFRERFLLLNPV
jgi:hypothetical protein